MYVPSYVCIQLLIANHYQVAPLPFKTQKRVRPAIVNTNK